MGRKRNRNRRRDIVKEFDDYFGTGTLADWQRLCRDVGLDVEDWDLSSITKCRKALGTVHVNIWDLIDAVRCGEKPRTFPSHHALRQYTINTHRIYPKDKVKEMGPVKVLLRQIF